MDLGSIGQLPRKQFRPVAVGPMLTVVFGAVLGPLLGLLGLPSELREPQVDSHAPQVLKNGPPDDPQASKMIPQGPQKQNKKTHAKIDRSISQSIDRSIHPLIRHPSIGWAMVGLAEFAKRLELIA